MPRPEKPPPWRDRPWRDALRDALEGSGRPYAVVILDPDTNKAVTFASIDRASLPTVLVGIAADLCAGQLKVEPFGGGN